MNPESFNFTLISAVIGMGIVFLFLGILYLLMALLSIKPHQIITKDKIPHNIIENHEEKTIEWLIAALSAYLETESQQTTPTAIPWVHDRKKENSPWINVNKIKGDDIY